MTGNKDIYLVHKKASGEDLWGYLGSSIGGAALAYGINRGIFKNRDKLSNIISALGGAAAGATGYGLYAANKTKQDAPAPELKTTAELAVGKVPVNDPVARRVQALQTWNDPGFRGAIDVAAGAAGAAAGHTIAPDIIESRAKSRQLELLKNRGVPKIIDNKVVGLQDKINTGFDTLAEAKAARSKLEAVQQASPGLSTPTEAIAHQDKKIFGIQDNIGADKTALKALNARIDALRTNAQRRAQAVAAKGTSRFTSPQGRKATGALGGAAGVGVAEILQKIIRERAAQE